MSIYAIRFRVENGLCIAQVRAPKERTYGYYEHIEEWRDAKPEDILDIGIWIAQLSRPENPEVVKTIGDAL